MIVNYSSYKVEIKDIQYTTPEGRVFDKTVIVAFYNQLGEIITFSEFGHMDTRTIYDKIENKEEINLDYCYVKNFSLTVYRMYTLKEKNEHVQLYGFSAKNAFFGSVSTSLPPSS